MDSVGQRTGDRRLSQNDLQNVFPNLAADGYVITSPMSRRYNCIAWAAGDTRIKWDPTGFPKPGFFWPTNAIHGEIMEALISVFRLEGYEVCADESLESGFEKVVLYVNETGNWTHAAKQLPDGRWSSKLGDAEDVTHTTPHGVEGEVYGRIGYYMKRPAASTNR